MCNGPRTAVTLHTHTQHAHNPHPYATHTHTHVYILTHSMTCRGLRGAAWRGAATRRVATLAPVHRVTATRGPPTLVGVDSRGCAAVLRERGLSPLFRRLLSPSLRFPRKLDNDDDAPRRRPVIVVIVRRRVARACSAIARGCANWSRPRARQPAVNYVRRVSADRPRVESLASRRDPSVLVANESQFSRRVASLDSCSPTAALSHATRYATTTIDCSRSSYVRDPPRFFQVEDVVVVITC